MSRVVAVRESQAPGQAEANFEDTSPLIESKRLEAAAAAPARERWRGLQVLWLRQPGSIPRPSRRSNCSSQTHLGQEMCEGERAKRGRGGEEWGAGGVSPGRGGNVILKSSCRLLSCVSASVQLLLRFINNMAWSVPVISTGREDVAASTFSAKTRLHLVWQQTG